MTIDTSLATWQKIQAMQCPICAGALEQATGEETDREGGGLGIVRCTACDTRFALYLSGESHGVEQLPG
jgi:hypothetical protein